MDNSVLETEWEERLNEFETGCSKNFSAWCKEKDYSLHQAKYWRKKLQNCNKVEKQSPLVTQNFLHPRCSSGVGCW